MEAGRKRIDVKSVIGIFIGGDMKVVNGVFGRFNLPFPPNDGTSKCRKYSGYELRWTNLRIPSKY